MEKKRATEHRIDSVLTYVWSITRNNTMLLAVVALGGCMDLAAAMDDYNRRDNQARRQFGVVKDWTCVPESLARVGQTIYEKGRDATVTRVVGTARGVCCCKYDWIKSSPSDPLLVEIRVHSEPALRPR